MARILNIDTTTNCCSVALAESGILLGYKETTQGMSHSSKLGVFIEELLFENQLQAHQLDAVAVSSGPGSYTGLRIGVSTAKGLCYGADLPLIAVSTLQALAYACAEQVSQKEGLICPMLDARRMEVYSAIYSLENNCLTPDAAVIVEENSYAEELNNGPLYLCGNGAPKTKELLTHSNAHFVDGIETSAQNMLQLSWQKFQAQAFVDLAYFEPFYLKSFVAGTPKKLL